MNEWIKSYIAHVSSRRLFRALNIESNLARPVIIQIPTQSPGRGASSYFYSKQIRLMCQVLTHCGFSGVSPDGNCAYVFFYGSFTSNSRSVRRAIWFTWFSEPHECIQHLAVPGGHPSNYEPGATLLNFSYSQPRWENAVFRIWFHYGTSCPLISLQVLP